MFFLLFLFCLFDSPATILTYVQTVPITLFARKVITLLALPTFLSTERNYAN